MIKFINCMQFLGATIHDPYKNKQDDVFKVSLLY